MIKAQISGILAAQRIAQPCRRGCATPAEFGAAYAYLDTAGSQSGAIRQSRVFETYARHPITSWSDVSAYVQWVTDDVRGAQNPCPGPANLSFYRPDNNMLIR